MVPGVNCMYWPGPPKQTKGKEKNFHLPENNDKSLYKAKQIMNGQRTISQSGSHFAEGCLLPTLCKQGIF